MYSVTSLTEALKSLLAGNFPDVRVQGEVSNVLNARSGHWYFTLKDERAEISCVCFRQDAAYLRAKPKDGLAVVARGRISVYEKKGAYQLYVNALELLGTGALQEQFETLESAPVRRGAVRRGAQAAVASAAAKDRHRHVAIRGGDRGHAESLRAAPSRIARQAFPGGSARARSCATDRRRACATSASSLGPMWSSWAGGGRFARGPVGL